MALTPHDRRAARALGSAGETTAAARYQQAGFEIVDCNWRCFEGEIDLILRRGGTIVFCEVKTRSSSRFIDPSLAITPAKQAKVRTAAFRWLAQNPLRARMRFDVAIVIGDRVEIIEGAF